MNKRVRQYVGLFSAIIAYLVTDHTAFYERYGWEFLCMVQGDGETNMSRMYVHQ